ncbi:MAG: peptide MFS transporter [Myxococcales bacterium FL481]|nr:MAG: peptide MFS transporter [Myxococcales bacterium FL481]
MEAAARSPIPSAVTTVADGWVDPMAAASSARGDGPLQYRGDGRHHEPPRATRRRSATGVPCVRIVPLCYTSAFMDRSEHSAEPQGYFSSLVQLPARYWVSNWMEVVERFAYYGVRASLPTYMVLAHELGGPEFTHIQKGQVYLAWALVQSIGPIFLGGFADRYGYKAFVALSTFLKIGGYVVMGWAIELAALAVGGSLARDGGAAGGEMTYPIFFAGAMLLAFGTATFKPAIQGIIARSMPTGKEALGWSTFYQMVNLGGFLGPIVGGGLRVLDWKYVFLSCAIGIALNFIPLFFIEEPERKEGEGFGADSGVGEVLLATGREFIRPRVIAFTMVFSGFWLMYNQIFDILPNFIDDWVDTRSIATALVSVLGSVVPVLEDGNLAQEWVLAINYLEICLLASLVGFLIVAKMRPVRAMILGVGICIVGTGMIGLDSVGTWVLFSIALFSFGEMIASPTKSLFFVSMAPKGKEGMYLGFVTATQAIGWGIGSLLAGSLYDSGGDKVVLARRHLVEAHGLDADVVASLSKTEVVPRLAQVMGTDTWGVSQRLWDVYQPYTIWFVFAGVGVCSLVGMLVYDRITTRIDARKAG